MNWIKYIILDTTSFIYIKRQPLWIELILIQFAHWVAHVLTLVSNSQTPGKWRTRLTYNHSVCRLLFIFFSSTYLPPFAHSDPSGLIDEGIVSKSQFLFWNLHKLVATFLGPTTFLVTSLFLAFMYRNYTGSLKTNYCPLFWDSMNNDIESSDKFR